MILRSSRLAPEGLADDALASVLGELGYRARGPRRSTENVTWFDTHDGALARAGCHLALRRESGIWELRLDDGRFLSEPGGEDPPEGSGPIGLLLSARLRSKARCPSLRAVLEESRWRVGSLAAAPLEVGVQRWTFSPPFAVDPVVPSIEVGIASTAGDLAAGDYLMALIEKRLALLPSAGNPGALGLRLLQLQPPGGPPPLDAVPNSLDTVAEAAARILRAQAWKMRVNRDGAVQDIDSEYIHDLRVATRRARFALHLFVDIFGRPLCDELRGELSWVARTLGPMRDIDVLRERLPSLLARVEANGDDSAFLARVLGARRAEERKGVVACLGSERYEHLVHTLESMEPPGPDTMDAVPLSVVAFAHRRVARALSRIRAHVGSRAEILEPAQLHGLRILFKRLRYTCEFFSSVCDVSVLIEASTAFQDQLGRYQDGAAAIEFLSSLPKRDASLLLGAMIQVYRESRGRARERFLRLWKMRGDQLVRWKHPAGG
jgi:CHAD domain-containing protein